MVFNFGFRSLSVNIERQPCDEDLGNKLKVGDKVIVCDSEYGKADTGARFHCIGVVTKVPPSKDERAKLSRGTNTPLDVDMSVAVNCGTEPDVCFESDAGGNWTSVSGFRRPSGPLRALTNERRRDIDDLQERDQLIRDVICLVMSAPSQCLNAIAAAAHVEGGNPKLSDAQYRDMLKQIRERVPGKD